MMRAFSAEARASVPGMLRSSACFGLLLAIPSVLASALVSAAEPDVGQQIKAGLVPAVVIKQKPPQLTPLPARMEALQVPAVSIAVVHKGKLTWAEGFGTMNPGGPPVTGDTLFQAGSISKAVTAAAVMTLVQDRKLDLDVDVNRYLKTWKIASGGLTEHRAVTLRELLSHSAGVTVSGFGGYESGTAIPTLVQVLDGEPPANSPPIRVDTEPGTTWRYSGGGYTIVQQVLIDATGSEFPPLMRERLLVPLRMNQSHFQQPPAPDLVLRAAAPYGADGTPIKAGPHIYPEMAAAGLWTTPSDLARYAIGIQQALGGRLDGVLSQASARAMLSPVRSASGLPLKTPFYMEESQQGLGLVIGGRTDKKYFEHGGSTEGYQCYLVAYESGDGVAVMTNSNNGQRLIDEIVRSIAHLYKWPDFAPPQRLLVAIDPVRFDRYVGAYRSPSGELATFWREGKHLESRIWGEPLSEIFPSSDDEYFSKTADVRWVFAKGDGGPMAAGVKLAKPGHEQVLMKVEGDEGRIALEQSIKIERRVKSRDPAPGSEQALRELLADLARGEPNYGQLVPEFATAVRQERPGLQNIMQNLGAVQSVHFRWVLPGGADIFNVAFEHGTRGFQILMAPDGRIQWVKFYP